jgi:glycosyltransferase involved in cell wall biosynthesis
MYVPIVRNIWLKRKYHRMWGQQMLRGAAALIATAKQEREELIAGGLSKERIIVRRNGVEAPERLPGRGGLRKKFGIAEDAKLILFLGRLSAKKSPDLLVRTFVRLRKFPDTELTTLVFVGPDESGMIGRLQRMAKQQGIGEKLFFCGPLGGEAKWAAYRDADIFVLPSQNENFGNTAAEAMAAGTPVVVTEGCGIAPLLKDEAGLVVKHEEQNLCEALLLLLRDEHLYGRLREGCAKVVAGLGWGGPVHDMEVIYSRLVQGVRA